MSDDAPPVRPWSEVKTARAAVAGEPPRPTDDYKNFREYFNDTIAPGLKHRDPEVQLGYSHLKRRG